MLLDNSLEQSQRWMVASSALIDGSGFLTSNRSRVAVALLHLSIEHHKGIHTLVDAHVLGSAFALLRPQMEFFVRGAWYHRCASDHYVTRFIDVDEPTSFGAMIQQLQSIEGFDAATLSSIKKDVWKNLCDFTHGGTVQVKARVTAEEITPNYQVEHIFGLLESSASLSLLATIASSALTDS